MIYVHTYKYGGQPHYSYPMQVIAQSPELWVLRGEYGRLLEHHTRGQTFSIPNISIEFVWPGRGYSVAVDMTNGKPERYYCNIILPAVLSADRVEWVDLDLDLLVAADLTWKLDDEDEFEVNQRRFGYPPEVVAGARQAAAELIALVEARAFPFDGSWRYEAIS
ncbi:MAG TPA: DUF402 domain-containing protein [Symbiobacteriaceae bacterium]|nr:DUF402 domain-containing protein [Symbiobacteriaceae bacterium]